MPTVLSDANKQSRKERAQLIKSCLAEAGEMKYSRYIIEDETWVYHEKNRSVDTQVHVKAGESRPQFPKPKNSPKKSIVLIAIAADCKLSVDILLPNETMDAINS